MANESSTLPPGVADFLTRLQAAASSNAQAGIDTALESLSNTTIERVQRALQQTCDHAMDHRAMQILSDAFAQIAREALPHAVDARMRLLLAELLSREGGK